MGRGSDVVTTPITHYIRRNKTQSNFGLRAWDCIINLLWKESLSDFTVSQRGITNNYTNALDHPKANAIVNHIKRAN